MKSKNAELRGESDKYHVEVVESSRQTPSSTAPMRLMRFGEVRDRTGLSRSTIWRLERGGTFPKRVKVSVNVVAWREDQVYEWIRSKCS